MGLFPSMGGSFGYESFIIEIKSRRPCISLPMLASNQRKFHIQCIDSYACKKVIDSPNGVYAWNAYDGMYLRILSQQKNA